MRINRILLVLCFLCLGGRVSFVLAQQGQSDLTAALGDFGSLNGGQNNADFSLMGGSDARGFSLANLIGSLLFGGIGFIAFLYGKKQGSFKPLLIGIALMAYPYFLKSTWGLYAAGAGLCLLLYCWRD